MLLLLSSWGDNETYLQLQSKKILERVDRFGGKLYLEFGSKLFDDYHASRVLPGFEPDGKMKMLLQLKEQAEIVIAICAGHIEQNKRRGDLGITYDMDVMRLIDAFRSIGLYVGSVVITQYAGQHAADLFQHKLEDLGVKVYKHYPIEDYPSNVGLIVSDDGFGKNDYIETTRPVVVVTAPGPGSGKMATCLSQLYHEHKRGVQTAAYSVEIWKRFRKWGGIPTGLTQNVKDLLSSREVENIFENSDMIIMLNQAAGDRQILAKQLNISPHQLSYVTHSGEGEGLLFFGNVILPFVDRFPTDLELYRIMTTKLGEVSEGKKE